MPAADAEPTVASTRKTSEHSVNSKSATHPALARWGPQAGPSSSLRFGYKQFRPPGSQTSSKEVEDEKSKKNNKQRVIFRNTLTSDFGEDGAVAPLKNGRDIPNAEEHISQSLAAFPEDIRITSTSKDGTLQRGREPSSPTLSAKTNSTFSPSQMSQGTVSVSSSPQHLSSQIASSQGRSPLSSVPQAATTSSAPTVQSAIPALHPAQYPSSQQPEGASQPYTLPSSLHVPVPPTNSHAPTGMPYPPNSAWYLLGHSQASELAKTGQSPPTGNMPLPSAQLQQLQHQLMQSFLPDVNTLLQFQRTLIIQQLVQTGLTLEQIQLLTSPSMMHAFNPYALGGNLTHSSPINPLFAHMAATHANSQTAHPSSTNSPQSHPQNVPQAEPETQTKSPTTPQPTGPQVSIAVETPKDFPTVPTMAPISESQVQVRSETSPHPETLSRPAHWLQRGTVPKGKKARKPKGTVFLNYSNPQLPAVRSESEPSSVPHFQTRATRFTKSDKLVSPKFNPESLRARPEIPKPKPESSKAQVKMDSGLQRKSLNAETVKTLPAEPVKLSDLPPITIPLSLQQTAPRPEVIDFAKDKLCPVVVDEEPNNQAVDEDKEESALPKTNTSRRLSAARECVLNPIFTVRANKSRTRGIPNLSTTATSSGPFLKPDSAPEQVAPGSFSGMTSRLQAGTSEYVNEPKGPQFGKFAAKTTDEKKKSFRFSNIDASHYSADSSLDESQPGSRKRSSRSDTKAEEVPKTQREARKRAIGDTESSSDVSEGSEEDVLPSKRLRSQRRAVATSSSSTPSPNTPRALRASRLRASQGQANAVSRPVIPAGAPPPVMPLFPASDNEKEDEDEDDNDGGHSGPSSSEDSDYSSKRDPKVKAAGRRQYRKRR